MQKSVLNKQGKFGVKILWRYTDMAIFVLRCFILTHPVYYADFQILSKVRSYPTFGTMLVDCELSVRIRSALCSSCTLEIDSPSLTLCQDVFNVKF